MNPYQPRRNWKRAKNPINVNNGWQMGSNLAKRAINRHEWQKTLTASEVCQVAEAVGAGLLKAISFKDGRLKVVVRDYDTVGKLKLSKPTLLDKINEKIGQSMVQSINFQLGDPSTSFTE